MRRPLIFTMIMLLFIAACGSGSNDTPQVVQSSPIRNFPTTAPVSPSPLPSPTNSFGSVNPTTGCPIPTGWQAYIVRFGDTLGTLADSIGSTVANIQQGNCLSTETIFTDQLIFLPSLPIGIPTVDAALYIGTTANTTIPTATTSISVPINCSPPPGWVAYTVQPGDTLGDLATRTNTTVGNLQNGNCLLGTELIYVGQILYLPRTPSIVPTSAGAGVSITPTTNTTCAIPTGWIPYVVRAGDTLGLIAQTYNTTVAMLQNGNCLANTELIYVGQTLYVPSSVGVVVTAAPTLTPSTAILATATATQSISSQAPQLSTLTVRPTLPRDDGALVTLQSEIALDVGVVVDADIVRYYAGISASDPSPVQIGQDTDPFDGTQITYTFNSFDAELYFFAIAQNEFGTSKSPTVHVVYDPTYTLGSGAPDVFPFLGFDGTIYTLQLGATVTIRWLNYPANAVRVDFLLLQGTQARIIASDTNLNDGARSSWTITEPLTGQLYALATLSSGQTIESDRVFVFVQGTN